MTRPLPPGIMAQLDQAAATIRTAVGRDEASTRGAWIATTIAECLEGLAEGADITAERMPDATLTLSEVGELLRTIATSYEALAVELGNAR